MAATIDLITGFLGAGKTTFIKRYTDWMDRHSQPYVIVENEFGVLSVDSAMLRQTNVPVVDLVGGCICCGLKIRFTNLLADLARNNVRIIVEPSGIFNPHDFFDVVNSPGLRENCRIGAVIAIVDAHALSGLSGSEWEIMREQALCSGQILLSKTNALSQQEKDACATLVSTMLEEQLPVRVETRHWDEFTDEDFARFSQATPETGDRRRTFWNHGALFEAMIVHGAAKLDSAELAARLDHVFTSPEFGTVLRIKGYYHNQDGGFFEVNCTRNDMSLQPRQVQARSFLTVIGEKLNRSTIESQFKPVDTTNRLRACNQLSHKYPPPGHLTGSLFFFQRLLKKPTLLLAHPYYTVPVFPCICVALTMQKATRQPLWVAISQPDPEKIPCKPG